MVQNYSQEEKRGWEDFRYGLFLGSRNFVERIKSKYLTENPDVEIPQKLIRAGRSGSAQRVMRYYSGDGLERPLSFDCTVGPGPKPGVIVESCEGHGARFQNNFMPQGGHLPVSRQWAGPRLGYITIQTLRP